MSGNKQGLGELELQVLNALWDAPGRTVQEVAEEFANRRGCARTTILTVMGRLHAKRFLQRRKSGGVFRYSPTQGRPKVVAGLIKQFVDTFLDGSPAPFLAYFVESDQLTAGQVKQLRAMVRQLEAQEKGAPNGRLDDDSQ